MPVEIFQFFHQAQVWGSRLFWDGKFHHPFATEGGHCDYSCRSTADLEMHNFLLRNVRIMKLGKCDSWSGHTFFSTSFSLRNKKIAGKPGY